MAKQIIIKGTPVVAANEVLVADSNSKIPAVDGSLVTAMSGTNVGSGTIATARLDTGTAANKIVVLDGSAKIPAVDGSLLTGIVSYTKSASDPTISTNPSGGVGTEWVNHTTGKQFICTDATAGANVWSCSGSHSGDIVPYDSSTYGGTAYGYHAGGLNPPYSAVRVDQIGRYSFTSNGNATDVADMFLGLRYGAGALSNLAGYVMAGHDGYAGSSYGNGSKNHIQKFIFSTEANMTDVGDTLSTGEGSVGVSSTTHGYRLGGGANHGNAPYGNEIEKFAFATDGNATDVANMLTWTFLISGHGHSSAAYGYVGGGGGSLSGSPGGWDQSWTTIQKHSFAACTDAVDSGQDLLTARYNHVGITAPDYGYTAGGNGGSGNDNVIQKFSFVSASNATDVGDLTTTCNMPGGSSSTTYGYRSAGYGPYQVTIDKWSFSSDGNATDVGDVMAILGGYGGTGFHV